ncbi:PP2C family protein-serine/threonine phosphatase [Micromonospora sp. MS34]|uniref:PP2C family protein-serine/threonine phosphatase n=1 Tax=Micromonospora sp. MS34 TaxID=3385971 RepID=UPI0039A39C1F
MLTSVNMGAVLGEAAGPSYGQPGTGQQFAVLVGLAEVVAEELERRLADGVGAAQRRALTTAAGRERDRLRLLRSVVTRTLDSSAALPAVPGLTLAAFHRPAAPTGLGGDFLDVFPLDDGAWGVIVGDVCGSGVTAASLTAHCWYVMRRAADRSQRPAAMLRALNDELLHRTVDANGFCTALCALVKTGDGGCRVTIASGGHPEPLLVRQENGVVRPRTLGLRPGPMLGVRTDPVFPEVTLPLALGDTLLAYTDGLTEARLPSGAMVSEAGVAAAVGALDTVNAGKVIDCVRQLLSAATGSRRPDDVAALALTAGPSGTATVSRTATARAAGPAM